MAETLDSICTFPQPKGFPIVSQSFLVAALALNSPLCVVSSLGRVKESDHATASDGASFSDAISFVKPAVLIFRLSGTTAPSGNSAIQCSNALRASERYDGFHVASGASLPRDLRMA